MSNFKDMAELLKVMAHHYRLEVLQKLANDVLCVSDMEELLGTGQSNISQHLALLRRAGLVDYYEDGKMRCYFLKDPRVLDILAALQKEHSGSLPVPACCPVRPGKRKHPHPLPPLPVGEGN
jgi:DNA-binding transcriptional ArsR family regulator